MKFSIKLVLSTMIVLALALGFSGFYFVNYVFETSLDREVGQALDESSILSFAFETAALNVPLKYSVLPDSVVEEIASKLEWEARAADAFFGSRMRRKTYCIPAADLLRTRDCFRRRICTPNPTA